MSAAGDEDLSTEAAQRLLEIGYVAAGNGFFAEAERIFVGLQAARPDAEQPQIGQAIAAMNAGKAADAVRMLESAVAARPQSAALRAFLGLALCVAGRRHDARQALETAAAGDDPAAAGMAKGLLASEFGAG